MVDYRVITTMCRKAARVNMTLYINYRNGIDQVHCLDVKYGYLAMKYVNKRRSI